MITGRQVNGFVKKIRLLVTELRKILQRCAKRFIEVLKMVKLQSSKMFIKDPTDVWGKEHTIGNAELAARLGSPMVLDRRGSVLVQDTFDSSTLKGVIDGSAASTMTISTDRSFIGDGCLKYVGAFSTDHERLSYKLTEIHGGRMGMQALIATAGATWDCRIECYYYDGTNLHAGSIGYDNDPAPSKSLAYTNSAGISTEFSDLRMFTDSYAFNLIKLVVDFDSDEYVRFLIGGNEIDMSGIDMYSTANATAKHILFRIRVDGDITAYIDDVIITNNEQL